MPNKTIHNNMSCRDLVHFRFPAQTGTRSCTRPRDAKVPFAVAGTSWTSPLEPDVLVLMAPPRGAPSARGLPGTRT